jgi:Tol biopolymer transport system component
MRMARRNLWKPLLVVALVVWLLASCAAPRFLSYPFDPAGRSLNSPYTEADPQIAGRYIVFTSTRRNRQDVYLFDGVAQRLIELPGLNALDVIATHPAVSADGNTIVFAGNRRGHSDIYLYNRETRQLRNLTDTLDAEVRNPCLSADGRTIAFESAKQGQWDLEVIDRSGHSLLPAAAQGS